MPHATQRKRINIVSAAPPPPTICNFTITVDAHDTDNLTPSFYSISVEVY